MDPDLVRQQAEAERESLLAALRKQDIVPPAEVQRAAAMEPPPHAPPPSAIPPSSIFIGTAPLAARPKPAPVFAIFGRFVMCGIAGAIIGGGLGAAVAELGHLAAAEANVMKLSLIAAAALACGAISLAVRE